MLPLHLLLSLLLSWLLLLPWSLAIVAAIDILARTSASCCCQVILPLLLLLLLSSLSMPVSIKPSSSLLLPSLLQFWLLWHGRHRFG